MRKAFVIDSAMPIDYASLLELLEEKGPEDFDPGAENRSADAGCRVRSGGEA